MCNPVTLWGKQNFCYEVKGKFDCPKSRKPSRGEPAQFLLASWEAPLATFFSILSIYYQFPWYSCSLSRPQCPYPLFHPESQRKKKSTAATLLPFPQGCCFYKLCPTALHPSPGCAANPLPEGAEGVEFVLQGCSNATGIKTLAL